MSVYLNDKEIKALYALPWDVQLLYILGIRPHLDHKTGIVGIKRKISYQHLSECLYVEPHRGFITPTVRKPRIKKILKWLKKEGLIIDQPHKNCLIFKLPMAIQDKSAKNKGYPQAYPPITEKSTPLKSNKPIDSIELLERKYNKSVPSYPKKVYPKGYPPLEESYKRIESSTKANFKFKNTRAYTRDHYIVKNKIGGFLPKFTKAPDKLIPDERTLKKSEELEIENLDFKIESFLEHSRSINAQKSDWQSGLRAWLIKSKELDAANGTNNSKSFDYGHYMTPKRALHHALDKNRKNPDYIQRSIDEFVKKMGTMRDVRMMNEERCLKLFEAVYRTVITKRHMT